jgi:hypothetical protein
MQIAADKGNKNFKIYKEDGKFAGIKDIKKNKLYRDHRYKGTKGIPITKHPNNKEVQYFLEQAKRFKTERPNQTLGSYFVKYGKTPTYSEIYSFLRLGDRASDQTKKQNRLEIHHRKTMAVSPTDNFQLALFDDNTGANKIINDYNTPGSEFYKNKNYADKELKKLNINLKIPGTKSFIGSEVLSPEKSLAVAKRKTVNLLKKEIEKDPKAIERLIASIGCPGKGRADGGRIGFSEGTDCFNKGLKAVNEVKIKPGAQARNFAKFANRAYKLGRGIMKFGVIPEALFVGADSLIRMNLGDTLDESLYRAADFFISGNQTDYADVLKIERTVGPEAAEVFRNVTKWKRKNEELQSLEQAEQADLALAGTDFAETNSGVSADETRKTYAGLKDKKRKEVLDASVSKDDQVLSQSYFDEAYDISKAKSTSAKIKGNVLEDESGLNVDLLAPEKNQQFQKIKNFREDMEFSEDDILKEINSNIQKGFYKNVEEAKLHYFQTLFAKKKFKEKPLSSFVLDDGYTPEQVYGTQGGEGFLNKINREKFIRPGTYEATPEEIDANFDMQGGIMAASGGRIGFKDGPKNPGRRTFMKLAAGIASIPIFGKFFKGAKVAKLIKPIPNSNTVMPDWFPNFVDKFVGRSIGKKIDADLIEYTNPDLPNIKLTRKDDGSILVEGKNEFNEAYNISYEPPGYELIDETTGKAVKTKGEFEAVEGRHVALGPEDYDTDAFYADDLDELYTSDIADMEKYTTGDVTNTAKDAFGRDTRLKKGMYDSDMAQGQAENQADILADEGLDEID